LSILFWLGKEYRSCNSPGEVLAFQQQTKQWHRCPAMRQFFWQFLSATQIEIPHKNPPGKRLVALVVDGKKFRSMYRKFEAFYSLYTFKIILPDQTNRRKTPMRFAGGFVLLCTHKKVYGAQSRSTLMVADSSVRVIALIV